MLSCSAAHRALAGLEMCLRKGAFLGLSVRLRAFPPTHPVKPLSCADLFSVAKPNTEATTTTLWRSLTKTTLNNGYLGSRNDEERSEMRYVV